MIQFRGFEFGESDSAAVEEGHPVHFEEQIHSEGLVVKFDRFVDIVHYQGNLTDFVEGEFLFAGHALLLVVRRVRPRCVEYRDHKRDENCESSFTSSHPNPLFSWIGPSFAITML